MHASGQGSKHSPQPMQDFLSTVGFIYRQSPVRGDFAASCLMIAPSSISFQVSVIKKY
jgi:hypothetical protein